MNNRQDREFYLESLRDLEAEYESGEVSEKDYKTLKDAYTKRASRAVQSGSSSGATDSGSQSPPRRSSPPFYKRWVALTIIFILVISAAGGIFLALSTGQRSSSDEATGDVRSFSSTLLRDADEAFAQARNNGDIGGIVSAIDLYEQVLEENPSNLDAHISLARAYIFIDDIETARIYLDDALALDPSIADEPLVEAMGDLIYVNGLVESYGAGTPPENLDGLTELVDLGLPDVETARRISLELASPNLQYREYELAAKIIELTLVEAPETLEVLLAHGAILTNPAHNLGDEAAEAGFVSLDKAIELNPENTEILFNRADAYFLNERYDDAIADVTTAIEREPENTQYLYVRAATYVSIGNIDEAIVDIDRAIELESDPARGWRIKGEFLFNADRNEEALEAFEMSAQLSDGDDAIAEYSIAIVLLTLDRYDEALVKIDLALNLLERDIFALSDVASSDPNAITSLRTLSNLQMDAENIRRTIIASIESSSSDEGEDSADTN